MDTLNQDVIAAGESDFSTLGLKDVLCTNLATLGYETMTPIQAEGLPLMLAGHDLIAQAETGSGKTVAFGLLILQHLQIDSFTPQALILCPVRELAEQICQVLRRLARLMPNVKILNLSGGMPMRPQVDALKHGAHIIVGTPGRVQKHIDKATLPLSSLKLLVLDEADRMLDMGFFDAIKSIITLCPTKRQTLLFSATYPMEFKQVATAFMKNPKQIVIKPQQTELAIEQLFYEVPMQSHKLDVLALLLKHYQATSTLIFCNTKEKTQQVATFLRQQGFGVNVLNGDMEQADRDLAMICFTHQSCPILVATDVAARGLDIKDLPLVINVDLPFDYDIYIHRIGRTGRAGSSGKAISLTTPADAPRLCVIEEQGGRSLQWESAEGLKKSAPIKMGAMKTLSLNLGKKDKIRPGDILGVLIKEANLPVESIGKIDIAAMVSYVSICDTQIDKAYQFFQRGLLKGRKVRVKRV